MICSLRTYSVGGRTYLDVAVFVEIDASSVKFVAELCREGRPILIDALIETCVAVKTLPRCSR
jgi:hypothetical protein